MTTYTEGPIRQKRLEGPWEGMVAGVMLGDEAEAVALLRGAARNPEAQAEVRRRAAARARPDWGVIVGGAEWILGRKWAEMAEGYGDWGRDGTLAGGDTSPGLEAGGGGARIAGFEVCGRGAGDSSPLASSRGRDGTGGVRTPAQGQSVNSPCLTPLPPIMRSG